MQLRPYQQDAANAALAWIKRCLDPCLIEAPTASGKSWVIAALAHEIKKLSGKKVLALAPTGELVEQNHEKYLATGDPASIYSASVGKKTMHHDVVFGSPLTVVNGLQRFGKQFAAVALDECFSPDTMIMTLEGEIRIDDPSISEKHIACFNEQNGAIEFHKPKKVWYNGTKNISLVKHSEGYIKCTSTHKIYVEGSWIAVKDVRQGQKMTLNDSQRHVFVKLLRASAAVAKKLYQTLIAERLPGCVRNSEQRG